MTTDFKSCGSAGGRLLSLLDDWLLGPACDVIRRTPAAFPETVGAATLVLVAACTATALAVALWSTRLRGW